MTRKELYDELYGIVLKGHNEIERSRNERHLKEIKHDISSSVVKACTSYNNDEGEEDMIPVKDMENLGYHCSVMAGIKLGNPNRDMMKQQLKDYFLM